MLHHYNYTMFRRQQEELTRQAEYEREIRAAKLQQRRNWSHDKSGYLPPRQGSYSSTPIYRGCANWFGTRLVKWGRKLEHFGALRDTRPTPSTSPHH